MRYLSNHIFPEKSYSRSSNERYKTLNSTQQCKDATDNPREEEKDPGCDETSEERARCPTGKADRLSKDATDDELMVPAPKMFRRQRRYFVPINMLGLPSKAKDAAALASAITSTRQKVVETETRVHICMSRKAGASMEKVAGTRHATFSTQRR